MAISVGIVGVGAFAQHFIPLIKAHPLVDRVVLCDLDADKLAASAAKHGIAETVPSLEALCSSSVDAVTLFTQNWAHGPQAIQALQAGKDVYSAVPSAITLDEITQLVRTVETTGRIYMIGETSYYYPAMIYCRNRCAAGDFGRIVYAEAEYYHDFDHGLYDVMKWRGGADWKRYAGSPPMFYPTHSVSAVVSVTGARVTRVSCMGYEDKHDDGLFRRGVNLWDNTFSNQTMLAHMSDGSVARFNEFRRVGHPGTVRMSMWGTDACFESNLAGSVWATKNRGETARLDELLACSGMAAAKSDMDKVTADDGTHLGASKVHDVARLPREYRGLPNGHAGSHQFLIHDFVTACANRTTPPNNVWQAARYLVPGLVAHESSLQRGKLLDVPDLGSAPDA